MATERVGKYEVLAALTEGGMAQLFLGATAGPGGFRKYVVIKRVLPSAAQDETFERMFLDEARITAAFSHPGIAQVYDLGEDERGLYVVMEFIAGQNLNQVMHACAKAAAILPLGFSIAVLHECAIALHYAHTFKDATGEPSPVIHRDVAQKNIMVTYDGQVKLLDFGIAKITNSLSKTKVGIVKGTAGYMSPEQVKGEALDARSDVFSLGVVLWEMVTGRRLYTAETEIEELRMILELDPQPPSEVEPSVPEELSRVILKALAKEREQRYGTARELARALHAVAGDYLFDVEARADFMRERFSEKIESTRALFEVAANPSTDAVDHAIKNYQRQSKSEEDSLPPQLKKRPRTQISDGRLEPVRRRAKQKSASSPQQQRVPTPVDVQLESQIAEAARQDKGGSMLPLLAVAMLLVGGGAFYWMMVGSPSTSSNEVIIGGPDEPRPIQLPAGQAPEKTSEKPTEKTEKLEKPVEKRAKQTGEVRLALIPEAEVWLGSQQLGEGAMVTFTLPAGTHLLTLVGTDGVKHALSLPVLPGKNRTQKFHVDELPVK